MWMRQSALPNNQTHLGNCTGFFRFRFPTIFPTCLIAVLLVFVFHAKGLAEEQIIVAITLNQQPQGDFFVFMEEDENFLIRTQDLEELGLPTGTGTRVERDGDSYVSLRSIEKLDYEFNESTLTIDLMAAPAILPSTTLDLSPARRRQVYYPADDSFFLNYGLLHETTGDNLNFARLSLSNEIGIRFRDILFLSDTIYTETEDTSKFVRLNNSFTYDQRDRERRFIAGDFFASSGSSLGSQVNMGGFSVRKIYRIDPYFIRYPLLDFTGQLPLPAEVSIYRDGIEVQSKHFNPGEFTLENFQGTSGAQNLEIVIRDSLGREERILVPFYFTDDLLRQGLHEYSYNIGLIRQEFGVSSNQYSKLAFSGFHRYGFSDYVNLGWRGEASEDLLNLGAESIFKMGPFGLMRLEVSASGNESESGTAGLASYEYQTRRFRSNLSVQSFSKNYATLATANLDRDRIRLNLRAGIGYSTPLWGSFNTDYTHTEYTEATDRKVVSLSWSRRLWKRSYLQATVRHIDEDRKSEEGWINLSWYFGRDKSFTARYERQEEIDNQTLEVRKNVPTGQGTGWELRAGRSTVDSDDEYLFEGFVQHNARHAILRSDYSQNIDASIPGKNLRLSVSGAMIHLGGTTSLTRPVRDSFGLVTIGDAEGVRVDVNGQLVGRTNRNGQAIVPEMSSYYENRVGFEDKDIPLDYLMPQVGLNVSPPLRSGSCINFPLKRYQAFTGHMLIESGEGTIPLANARLTLDSPAGPVTFWTSREGEFYLDSQMDDLDILSVQGCKAFQQASTDMLPAGTYPVSVLYDEKSFRSELRIPTSEEIFTELGTITLPALSSTAPEVDAVPPSKKDAEEPETAHPAAAAVQTPEIAARPDPELNPAEQSQDLNKTSTTLTKEPATSGQQADTTNMQQSLSFTIHFPLDSSSPLPSAEPVLAQTLHYIKKNPDLPIEIEGHGSQEGSEKYNLRLGYQRAEAFREYLLQAGINEQRIQRVVSYGEHRPVCEKPTEDCLQRNRRAVVLVVMPPEN